jgi:hypothetical protein
MTGLQITPPSLNSGDRFWRFGEDTGNTSLEPKIFKTNFLYSNLLQNLRFHMKNYVHLQMPSPNEILEFRGFGRV